MGLAQARHPLKARATVPNDVRCGVGLVNRNKATAAVARGLLVELQPQHSPPCCALRIPEIPMEWALLRCCGSKHVVGTSRVSQLDRARRAECSTVENRGIRPFLDSINRGTVRSSLSRESMGSIDADRACSPTKPAPHRPSASSNLRCQADGIWTSLPGPKPLSAIARPLTSHQLPARSLGQLVRRCAGKHPISPSSSEPNYNRLRPSRGQALSGCASARPGHCGRI
jgi:hypothetical protein